MDRELLIRALQSTRAVVDPPTNTVTLHIPRSQNPNNDKPITISAATRHESIRVGAVVAPLIPDSLDQYHIPSGSLIPFAPKQNKVKK